jgi:transposase-like protein
MKVSGHFGKETFSMTKRRKRHTPEQIVRKLRDADAMLSVGKDQAAVLQTLEVSQSTLDRWRVQYGGR